MNPYQFGRVIFADTAPTIDPAWTSTDWKWLNTTTRQWYYNSGTSWVAVVAGLTGEYEGTITKIKVENGLVTEVELE